MQQIKALNERLCFILIESNKVFTLTLIRISNFSFEHDHSLSSRFLPVFYLDQHQYINLCHYSSPPSNKHFKSVSLTLIPPLFFGKSYL